MGDAVLDWFEAEVEEQLQRDVKVACEAHRCSCRSLTVAGRTASPSRPRRRQATTSGRRVERRHSGAVRRQAQVQLLCTGASVCHVPALVSGFRSLEFRRYVVRRNDSFIAAIVEHGEEFWRCVESRTPPVEVPRLETLKRIRRLPASTVDLADVAAGGA
jgi:hypothetical protein